MVDEGLQRQWLSTIAIAYNPSGVRAENCGVGGLREDSNAWYAVIAVSKAL